MSQYFLTYSDAKSDKFWNITLNGCTHTVHYCRVETEGQTQTKEFATEDEARRSLEKLVREKLKKGYREGEQGSREREKFWRRLVLGIKEGFLRLRGWMPLIGFIHRGDRSTLPLKIGFGLPGVI